MLCDVYVSICCVFVSAVYGVYCLPARGGVTYLLCVTVYVSMCMACACLLCVVCVFVTTVEGGC